VAPFICHVVCPSISYSESGCNLYPRTPVALLKTPGGILQLQVREFFDMLGVMIGKVYQRRGKASG
jgi:hypothetical protein